MIIQPPKRKKERGAMIVEVAIAFTVVAVLIFYCIEAALIFQDKQTLTNMAREMARGISSGDSLDGAKARALQWNQGNIHNSSDPNTLSFYADQSADGSTWTQVQSSSDLTGHTGYLIRVTATYNGINFARFFGSGITKLQSAAVMRME